MYGSFGTKGKKHVQFVFLSDSFNDFVYTLFFPSECQQMLENFNALEDVCKSAASKQQEFQDMIMERIDQLYQTILDSRIIQPTGNVQTEEYRHHQNFQ